MPAMNSGVCIAVFDRCIADYHRHNAPETGQSCPYPTGSFEAQLYAKSWIDCVQWHLEDEIRNPDLPAERIAELKRRIDACNQRRNDKVERLDDCFLEHFQDCQPSPGARQNSETPAWLIDRLSILSLKLYHCAEYCADRTRSPAAAERAAQMLALANQQRLDLARCLDELIEDIRCGRRYMKVYRQLKMYNDEELNPVLKQRRQAGARN
ncbi:MAG: DUF4254 domain-containing protein [Leptospirales bacterium]|nr:DUF4254 domain-containing protein [Leptospirales bacterium]